MVKVKLVVFLIGINAARYRAALTIEMRKGAALRKKSK